jgi:TniQ
VTPEVGTLRWPLHPPPSAGEALTSWAGRLAALYGMTPGYLLRYCLGEASALLDDPRADDLDFDPPAGILQALAERTGTDPGVARLTTVAGWVPWLADTLDPCDGEEAFDTYVRQDSVLLGPGRRAAAPCELPILPTCVLLRSGLGPTQGGPGRSAHWMAGSGGSCEPASARS